MTSSHHEQPDRRQALKNLADEMNMHVGEVIQLYEASVAELAAQAKVDNFLHVFAMRELLQKLKARPARDEPSGTRAAG